MNLNKPVFDSGSLFVIPEFAPKLAEVDWDWNPEDARINFPLSADAELKMDVEMPANKLLGMDLSKTHDMSYSVQLSEPYQEQIRRHKKKRINKKWAKRYGYRTRYKNWRFNEVSLVPKGLGHEFEFMTNNVPLMTRGE